MENPDTKMNVEKQTEEVKETAKNVVKDTEEILSEKFKLVEASEELKTIADTLSLSKEVQSEALKELEKMAKENYFLIDIFKSLHVAQKNQGTVLDIKFVKESKIYPEMVIDQIFKLISVF